MMKIFIPETDTNHNLVNQGFILKPLVIQAYKYHLSESAKKTFVDETPYESSNYNQSLATKYRFNLASSVPFSG